MEIISYLISSVIMVISSIIFTMILLEKKNLKITLKRLIIILLSIILYEILAFNLVGTIKSLCLCSLYVILFKYLFKLSYYEAILLMFMYSALIIIPDIVFTVLIILLGSTQFFYDEIAKTIFATLMVNIMFVGMIYSCKKWLIKLFKLGSIINREVIVYIVLTLGSILVVFYNATTEIKVISENFILSIIIMVLFVIILYSLLKQRTENKKIVEKYDKLLDFIKKYEIMIEEQRTLRHESKNQLITIKSKIINKNEQQEIIKYVDSLLNDHKVYKEDKYGKFQYLPANGIKGLFYYKAMEAEERAIKLSINIAEKVEKSVLGKLETEEFKQLGRILGVYIDNAIEASCISNDKKMGIEIYEHNKDVVIVISNTYSGKIDIESIGKIKYSTKGNGRGYGLMLVNKILTTNKRFLSDRKVNDKLYIQKLIIKNSIGNQ